MASPDFGLQMCPTRLDGHRVLFAHKVTQGQCQDRQRGHYHKCWTCAHNNALAPKNGSALPKPIAARAPLPVPLPVLGPALIQPAPREVRAG